MNEEKTNHELDFKPTVEDSTKSGEDKEKPVIEDKPEELAKTEEEPEKEPEEKVDKFSRGRVVRFVAQSRYGFIKRKKGSDVYFNLDEVRFAGEKGAKDLQEGQNVGYDVGRTSHGLHITKIKIYS